MLLTESVSGPAAAPGTSKEGSEIIGSVTPGSGIKSTNEVVGLDVNANVHSWNGGQLKPAIDRYTALGPLLWRVIIDRGDWESTQLPGTADTVDWNAYSTIYSTGKMSDLWSTVRYIEASPGQKVMINVMGGVPGWMGGSKIRDDKEDY
ncbi:hypothetical protein J2W21_000841 [Sinomonas atrocyanea]|uniref:hypothetical protein n=1 Tax=Sinomonas atrocyanea TaxID=37927 RepID=UPI002789D680|nr:hypothetical protein [Sinomonas atrocyanea]MDP9883351.1 hypothetical protein [Sinomonas atrocyanea]